MTTHAPRRLLFSALALASAMLACARADIPIDATGQSVATALVIPATSTAAPVAIASATNPLAEALPTGDATATSAPSPTPDSAPSTPTPALVFDSLPLLNGTFDADLSNWSVTPNWAVWQDGYVRLNAGQAGQGAVMVQFTTVPRGQEVRLHVSARAESAIDGECVIEAHRDTLHRFPADGAWHTLEVDYTLEAGTQTAVSLQARNNDHCDWLNLDDVYWLVAAGAIASAPTDTPGGPTPEAATAEPDNTATATAVPTVGAIPAAATFTQDFTVSAAGDSPFGAPADIADGQTLTWASLRGGTGAWVFDLGASRSVAGLRLQAHRDTNQDTTLLGVDVSADGTDWTTVYAATGDCAGTTGCQVIAQNTPVDLAFATTTAQYVRVRSGPTRFALAEVEIAVIGN